MVTLSRSRSSAKGDEDYLEWRETIERQQLESKRQMQALLQEIARLREENVVLRIQASSTGPPHGQRSRGQGANSRPNPESIYPGTAGVIPETCNVKPQGRHTPMHQASQEQSSDSTRLSSKRQRDKRPRLSDAMRTRLGPQEPGMTRPPVATTWGAHPDPLVTPMVQNVFPHQAVRQAGRNPLNEPPIGSISKRLDDMLSTPFCSHIIHYDPPRGFIVPKFSTYDGSSYPFDHIMHYRQLMTLDIGNDALLCKVFPSNLQGQALSWFHRLPPNSVDNFRDLSEAFENESLREFVKRFGQAVLQVKAYSMDAILQIFKRSICPGTLFFESLAKKPPTTMDDLFRRASKYLMLEDDVRAATQQVLVVGQASRSGAEKSAKPPDQPRPSNQRQGEQSRPERLPLTPLSISYEKLLLMIQDLSDFRWPRPLRTDPSKRDHSKKCAYHEKHGHTTEMCRSLHYFFERLIKAGHLKQYLRSDARVRDTSRNHNSRISRISAAPKAVINYINGGHWMRNTIPSEKDKGCCRQHRCRNASTPYGLG
ncbi:hypothetical protein CK203_055352 [Vitis vinifera]|uniref:Uncharacterized protein n=1 Tax=Vitis vinifera TaxID=29760 RepID=A0A438GSV6_VITVI|nr:hypothetical protein CK203_055352 [Vitis vinifera]